MPPQRRKQLGGNTPPPSNPLLDGTQTPPVSDLRDAEWSPRTPEPDLERLEPKQPPAAPERLVSKHLEPGSPAAVPDRDSGKAPLCRFAHRPDNPRFSREYDPALDEALRAMGETLDEYGVLQAITVVSREAWIAQHPEHAELIPEDIWWVVLMGNRRLAIARVKEFETLAFTRNDSLADAVRAKEASLIENRHRKDLDPIREAYEMHDVMDDLGISQRALAKRIGLSNGQVSQRLQLLELIESFKDLVSARKISADKARQISYLSPADQERLWELGEPYSLSRLNAPEPIPDDVTTTREAVRIAANSTAADIVDTMKRKMPITVIHGVARLLAEEIAQ